MGDSLTQIPMQDNHKSNQAFVESEFSGSA
jgi:hypothetical protein